MGVEGFMNVKSISRFCECDLLCFIIALHERQFPLVFYGETVSKVDCKFSHWVTCIS